MINVEKRNGEVVGFDLGRIRNAIKKAFDATSNKYTTEILDLIALRATADFQTKLAGEVVSVETIQDSVEKALELVVHASLAVSPPANKACRALPETSANVVSVAD